MMNNCPIDDLKSAALSLLEQRISLYNSRLKLKEAIERLQDIRVKIKEL